MSVLPKPELADEWRQLQRGDGVRLDVAGHRLTIRPFFGRGGYALRINGNYVATFRSIEQARAEAAKRIASKARAKLRGSQ